MGKTGGGLHQGGDGLSRFLHHPGQPGGLRLRGLPPPGSGKYPPFLCLLPERSLSHPVYERISGTFSRSWPQKTPAQAPRVELADMLTARERRAAIQRDPALLLPGAGHLLYHEYSRPRKAPPPRDRRLPGTAPGRWRRPSPAGRFLCSAGR